jgi:hypothetical protein
MDWMMRVSHRMLFFAAVFFFGLAVLERLLFQLQASPMGLHVYRETLVRWGFICLSFTAVILLDEIRRKLRA